MNHFKYIKMKHVFQWIFATASLLFLLSVPLKNYAQVDLDLNLVAYFPFNGNANDESTNSNHATLYGGGPALTTDRFGNASSAYRFDGLNDYMDAGYSYDYQYRTVSVWINPTDINNVPTAICQDANSLTYGSYFLAINRYSTVVNADIVYASFKETDITPAVGADNGVYISIGHTAQGTGSTGICQNSI